MSSPTIKEIKLKFTSDENSLKRINKDLEDLGKVLDLSDEEKSIISNTKQLQSELSRLQNLLSNYGDVSSELGKKIHDELNAQIEEYKEMLNMSSKDPTDEELRKQNQHDKFVADLDALKQRGINMLKDAGHDFLNKLKQTFKDGWKEFSEVLVNYSRLSNAETRDLAFTYGFSASQSYGFNQAMGVLGFQSEEDLYYANNQELTLFKEAFVKYSEKYEKLYDSGTFETLLEYNVEMKEFQEDMKLEVADFFMQNKDIIKAGLQAIMIIADAVLKIASFALGTYNRTSRSAAISDVISNYSNNKTVNITMENTYNGIDPSNQQNYSRLGALTVDSLIKGINGGDV